MGEGRRKETEAGFISSCECRLCTCTTVQHFYVHCAVPDILSQPLNGVAPLVLTLCARSCPITACNCISQFYNCIPLRPFSPCNNLRIAVCVCVCVCMSSRVAPLCCGLLIRHGQLCVSRLFGGCECQQCQCRN